MSELQKLCLRVSAACRRVAEARDEREFEAELQNLARLLDEFLAAADQPVAGTAATGSGPVGCPNLRLIGCSC